MKNDDLQAWLTMLPDDAELDYVEDEVPMTNLTPTKPTMTMFPFSVQVLHSYPQIQESHPGKVVNTISGHITTVLISGLKVRANG